MKTASRMTFQERLEAVQGVFTDKPVTISGGNRPPVRTKCLRVVHTGNENIDFICVNKTRYGMRLSEVAVLTEWSVLDMVSALNAFTRTVALQSAPTSKIDF